MELTYPQYAKVPSNYCFYDKMRKIINRISSGQNGFWTTVHWCIKVLVPQNDMGRGEYSRKNYCIGAFIHYALVHWCIDTFYIVLLVIWFISVLIHIYLILRSRLKNIHNMRSFVGTSEDWLSPRCSQIFRTSAILGVLIILPN